MLSFDIQRERDMKKFLSLAAVITLTSAVSACGGYETLSTPFNFRGGGVNLFGSDAEMSNERAGAYEIVVNAPAGTSQATAMNLFENEANKVCQGRPFNKVITSQGNARIRDFGIKGVNTSTVQSLAPSITGYVECQ